MAQWRISDRWLAVGLLTVAYLSACFISSQKGEASRLNAEAKGAEDKSLQQAKEKSRAKTEDGMHNITTLQLKALDD